MQQQDFNNSEVEWYRWFPECGFYESVNKLNKFLLCLCMPVGNNCNIIWMTVLLG